MSDAQNQRLDQVTKRFVDSTNLSVRIRGIAFRIDNSSNLKLYQAMHILSDSIYLIPHANVLTSKIQPVLDFFAVREGPDEDNEGFKEYLNLSEDLRSELVDILSECEAILQPFKSDSPEDMLAWVKIKALINYLDPTSLNYAIYQRQEKLLGNTVEG